MVRKKARQSYSHDQTLTAFAIGLVACAGMSYIAEIVFEDILADGAKLPGLPIWRMHMAAACLGLTAFVLIFYSLEALARGSKATAWRSTLPWIPLVFLTAAASIIHLPASAVVAVTLIYSFWAFRQTRSVR